MEKFTNACDFIKAIIPGFQLKYKNHSLLMKMLGTFLWPFKNSIANRIDTIIEQIRANNLGMPFAYVKTFLEIRENTQQRNYRSLTRENVLK